MKRAVLKTLSMVLVFTIVFSILSVGTVAIELPTVDLTITSADSIGYNEFTGNQFIGSITFNANDPEKDLVIPQKAFANCSKLKSVRFIGEGNIIINGIDAFYNCKLLENVSIENTGKLIFRGCSSFCATGIKELHLPSNVVFELCNCGDYCDSDDFASEAFYICESLEKVKIECDTITDRMFDRCPNLKSIYIPSTVTEIGSRALGYNLSRIEGFTIYGHTGSAAETYAVDNGFAFIPVDNIDSSISSTQASTGTVGSPSPVTLSVAGFPDYITTKSSLGSTQTIAREDAEIVTSESGEEWTFDVVPESETTELTVTATYCGGSLTATSEIAITAQKADTTTVKSVETTVPAVVGNTATVSVTVAESAEAIRFVNADSETITFGRETETVTDNGDSTKTSTVTVPVTKETEQYTVYAKYAQTGWSTDGTEFTLKARVLNYSTEIESIEFEESLDGVIYQGVNKMTIVTADGMTKVQLMKDGNTWTYNEQNATYEDKDGRRIWTINMNFSQLGDHTYDIRVRSTKTSFQLADTLDLTVYAR